MSKGGPRLQNTGTQTTNQTQNTSGSFSNTQISEVPEWVRQAGQQLFGQASDMANNFANNPLLQQFMGQAGQIGSAAPGLFNQGAGMAGNARGGNFAQTAIEELLGLATGGPTINTNFSQGPITFERGAVRDVNHRNFTDYDINQYMNPYTQQVVDSTLADVDRNSRVAALQRGSAAQRAGAFGGSRHGVLDALAAGETAREVGNLTGRLRSDAFNAAAGLIGRDQAGSLTAQQSNQQADMQQLAAAAQAAAGQAAGINAANAQLQGNRLAALQAALSGGINLGGLDTSQGNTLAQLGLGAQGALQSGVNAAAMPFNMLQGLGGLLAGIPIDRTSTQTGTSEGSMTGTGTQTGTGLVNQPNTAAQGAGFLMQLASAFL